MSSARERLAKSLGEARGLDPARRDRVDGHPVGADLPGERLRPADDSRTDRVRERQVVERLPHRARLDVDHPSVARAAEVGETEVRQPERGEQEQLDGGFHGLRVELGALVLGGPPPLLTRTSMRRTPPGSSRRGASGPSGSSGRRGRRAHRGALLRARARRARRANIATLAPSARSASAIARPMPGEAPQMIAVRPRDRGPSLRRVERRRRRRARPTSPRVRGRRVSSAEVELDDLLDAARAELDRTPM